jgi:hypothetical protein
VSTVTISPITVARPRSKLLRFFSLATLSFANRRLNDSFQSSSQHIMNRYSAVFLKQALLKTYSREGRRLCLSPTTWA